MKNAVPVVVGRIQVGPPDLGEQPEGLVRVLLRGGEQRGHSLPVPRCQHGARAEEEVDGLAGIRGCGGLEGRSADKVAAVGVRSLLQKLRDDCLVPPRRRHKDWCLAVLVAELGVGASVY